MLDGKVVEGIKKLIEELKQENHIVNQIIRDDVFGILQTCNCTVLYYPLDGEDGEGEGCDGCHLEKMIAGKMEQMVFINSNNTRERQAFSTAHELGHIWKADERLRFMFPEIELDTEEVINRFAAELLMPEEYFNDGIDEYLKKINYQGPTMKLTDMLGLIAYLMNYFFVPYRSVVKRMIELKRLQQRDEDILVPYKNSGHLADIIKAEQYTRLHHIDRIKNMDDLPEYLMKAQQWKLMNENKIKNIKKDFEISAPEELLPTVEVHF